MANGHPDHAPRGPPVGSSRGSEDEEIVAETLNDLSIEALIHQRVSMMLERLGGAPIADLHELVMREAERGLLSLMLERCNGNRGAAAQQLGLHRNTLRQKLEKLALAEGRSPVKRPPARGKRVAANQKPKKPARRSVR